MFDNVDDVVLMASLVLLGAFGVFIVLGIFWGIIRGRKKTIIRIITISVALPLALIVTPFISRSLLRISIPFGGETLSLVGHAEKFLADILPDKITVDGIEAYPQLIEGLAVVMLNLIVFLVLYFVFKWLSWIVYAIISAKVAPKHKKVRSIDDAGLEKFDLVATKKGRLSGAALGVVQAFIFFAFFMIPFTGLISALDKAASYQPSMAGFSSSVVRNSYDNGLMNAYNKVDDFNGAVQSSIFGSVSKYTGMQALGGFGFGYLMSFKVDSQKVNLVNDIVFGTRLFKDVAAIYHEFSDGGNFVEVIEGWDDEEYMFVKSVVERIFSVSFVKLVFESSGAVIDIVNDYGIIDGKLDTFDEAGHEGEFQADAVAKLKEVLTSEKIKSDLLNVVDLVQTIFAKTEVGLSGGSSAELSIYRSFRAILDAYKNDGDVGVEADKLTALLKSARNGEGVTSGNPNIAFDLMKRLFGFNFLQEILADADIAKLYQSPIDKYVPGVDGDDAVFVFDFSTQDGANLIYSDMAELLVSLSECFSVVLGFIGGDVMDSLTNMKDDEVLAFAGLMASITNSEMIGTCVRNVVVKFLTDLDEDEMFGEIEMLKGVDLFGSIIDMLDPDNNEELDAEFWEKEIKVVIDLVKFAVNFTGEEGDIGEGVISGSLGDLLRSVGDSKLVSDVVTEVVEGLVNDILGENAFVINDSAAFGALADFADGLLGIINDDFGSEGNLNPEDFFDVVFGGENKDKGIDALLLLAGVGAGPDGENIEPLINIDLGEFLPGDGSGYENDITNMLGEFLPGGVVGDYASILDIFIFTKSSSGSGE